MSAIIKVFSISELRKHIFSYYSDKINVKKDSKFKKIFNKISDTISNKFSLCIFYILIKYFRINGLIIMR
jgi:hypothetical protein